VEACEAFRKLGLQLEPFVALQAISVKPFLALAKTGMSLYVGLLLARQKRLLGEWQALWRCSRARFWIPGGLGFFQQITSCDPDHRVLWGVWGGFVAPGPNNKSTVQRFVVFSSIRVRFVEQLKP
jgi:hypothetical protein